MVRLLSEQVAGFYSLKDKTVYMMDWIPQEQQMAIMSHELTHALQDQTVDLKTWLEHGPHGEDVAAKAKDKSAEKTADPDEEISQDEAVMAREAVTEGQGMVVMIDYVLRHSGKNNLTDPAFVANLRADMMAASGSPVLNQAPLYLQEFLEFPYSYGLEFVRELQLKGGKRLAYEDVLEHPPVNSREIMEPQSYFAGEYAKSLAKRYKSAQNVKAESGRQGMRWMTDEGLVVIEALGNQVLVLESFDAAMAEKLRAAVFQPEAARLNSDWWKQILM